MYQIVLFIHFIVSVLLIALILVQQGKGAAMGAAFGSGASGTVFGSQGSGGFLFKLTGGLCAFFFATSLGLGYIVSTQYRAQHTTVSNVFKDKGVVLPGEVTPPVKKEK